MIKKSLLVLCFSFLLIIGCTIWQPGEDPKGKTLISEATQVVESLKIYEKEKGELPEKLEMLIPEYISESSEIVKYLIYSSDKREIALTYSPSWPKLGQNICSTSIDEVEWECIGYV